MDGGWRSAFRANLEQKTGMGLAAACASGKVALPGLVVEGIAEQGCAVLLGGLISGLDQRSGMGVIRRGKAAGGHIDDQIGKTLGVGDIMFDASVEGAIENADDRAGIGLRERLVLQMNGYDHAGVQTAAENPGRQIIKDAAINQIMAAAILNGRKDSGDRDGGADGLRQRSGGKGDRLQGVQIGGHAAKGDGKPVVVEFLAVVLEELGGQELIDAAIGKQRIAQRRAALEADGEPWGTSRRSWRRRKLGRHMAFAG